MKPEDLAKFESEKKERNLMMPGFEGADAREGDLGAPKYRVHVYVVSNPNRPYISLEADDRNSAKRIAIDFMVNGIVDLDGEFIPRHRIIRIMIQEEMDEWPAQIG